MKTDYRCLVCGEYLVNYNGQYMCVNRQCNRFGRKSYSPIPLRDKVKPDTFQLAKELKWHPTPSEKELWKYIRPKIYKLCRFTRQRIIRGWIVDFYCPQLRLVVELDGKQFHDKSKDIYRDLIMRELGLTILRFPSSLVFANINDILNSITNKIQNLSPASMASSKEETK